MNEDVKKNLRTQGKYAGGTDKRQKESPVNKESSERIPHARKRHSNEHKGGNNSFSNVVEEDSPVRYQENSSHSFNELEDGKMPKEIRYSGSHTLSETESGKSEILYKPEFYDEEDANKLFSTLLDDTKWTAKNIVIRGVEYPQPRLVTWYGPLPYTYSGATLEPQEMPDVILEIKKKIEEYLLTKDITASFNSVLLNCYRDGKDSVAWHSDDEMSMGVSPTIASISLGETRKFEMKRKIRSYKEDVTDDDVDKYFINLTHGSLLIMTGVMQRDWQHRIPKEYHDKDVRINLTFRTVHAIDRSPGISSENVRKQSEKYSKLDTPPNSKIKFNEDDFPPLSSTLNSVSLVPKESEDTRPLNSVFPSKLNDDINNTVKDFSNKSGVHSGVNDGESSDNQPYDINKSEENSSNKQVHHNVDNAEMWNSNVVENLSDSYEETDYDMTTKNIGLGDILNSSCCIKNAQSFDSNINSPSEPGYIKPPICTATSVNNGETLDCADNPVSIQKSNSYLNVDAQEFIPSISPVPPSQEPDYGSFDISKLLECDLTSITNAALWDYAYALRNKIMDCIEEYDYFLKDSLIFLYDLMEERQSERTQRLITERMHKMLCEYFDELDYSGNSGHGSKLYDSYSKQEYSQGEYTDSHRGKEQFRETGSNKDDMHNRNKRQNFRGRYDNRQDTNSSQGFPPRRRINSRRGYSTSWRPLSSKRTKSYTYESSREDWNNSKDHYYEEGFSGEEKEDYNRNCSSEKDLSSQKNWSSNTDNSLQEEKISGSESKGFSRYSSNSKNRDFSREKEHRQKKTSGRGNRNSCNDFYYEEFSGEEKENANKGYSKQEKNYDKKYSRDYSGHTEINSVSRNHSSNKDFSDCRKRDSNSEKDCNQKEIFDKRESDVYDRRKNFHSGSRITSRGRRYPSQDQFSNKEESHSNQEIFSNKEERNSGRGYSRNRKDFANQGRGRRQ